MKIKNSGAAAKVKAPARAAVRSKKSAGHSLAFFEYFRLAGMPAEEAGPACVVIPQSLDTVNCLKEVMRARAQMPSVLTLNGYALLPLHVGIIVQKDWSDDVDSSAEKLILAEANAEKWSQVQYDTAIAARTTCFYDGDGGRALSEMLSEFVRGKSRFGSTFPVSSAIIVPNLSEWEVGLRIDPETLGHLLASIYGSGGVYFADECRKAKSPTRGVRRRQIVAVSAPDAEKHSFDTNSDPGDDLPGDEWKKD